MERGHDRPVGESAEAVTDWVDAQVATPERLLSQSQLAVDRVTTRIRQTRRRVEHTYHQVQELAGAAQLTHRSTAKAADRFLQIKQGELAAHLAAAELHEQAAELQQRLDHPDRAAESRAHAEQARALHRLAAEELADYQARIAATRKRAGKPPRGTA